MIFVILCVCSRAVQCTLVPWQQTIPQAEPVVTPIDWVAQHFPLCHDGFAAYELPVLVIWIDIFHGGMVSCQLWPMAE